MEDKVWKDALSLIQCAEVSLLIAQDQQHDPEGMEDELLRVRGFLNDADKKLNQFMADIKG